MQKLGDRNKQFRDIEVQQFKDSLRLSPEKRLAALKEMRKFFSRITPAKAKKTNRILKQMDP